MTLAFAAMFLFAGPPRFLGPPEKKPQEGEPAAVAPGDPAPRFSGAVRNASAAGPQRFDLGKLFGKSGEQATKAVLISFFDPRCAACADELPVLDDLYAQYRDKGLQVVSVAADPRALLRARQVLHPVLADPKGAITRKYLGRKPRYPAAVLIGPDGKVASAKLGYRDAPSVLLRAEVENSLR